jgi:hypothetical protein
MATRVRRALRAAVLRSSDRRLEQVLGSRGGLRLLFAAMERAYVPGSLDGFTGEVGWDLRRGGGRTARWTLRVARGRAQAAPGAGGAPAVVVRTGVAELARIAVGQLDPMRALLAGDLDVEGDFTVASRLGELFGRRRG